MAGVSYVISEDEMPKEGDAKGAVYACRVRLSDEKAAAMKAAGEAVDGRYASLLVRVTDGVVEGLPAGVDYVGKDACAPVEAEWAPDKAATPPCACSSGKDCEALDRATPEDAEAWLPARTGGTLGPGRWRGAGCVPKHCLELAGDVAWPEGCP